MPSHIQNYHFTWFECHFSILCWFGVMSAPAFWLLMVLNRNDILFSHIIWIPQVHIHKMSHRTWTYCPNYRGRKNAIHFSKNNNIVITREHGKSRNNNLVFGFMPLLSSIAAVADFVAVRFIVCVVLHFKNKALKCAQIAYNVTMIFDTLMRSVIQLDLIWMVQSRHKCTQTHWHAPIHAPNMCFIAAKTVHKYKYWGNNNSSSNSNSNRSMKK